MNKSLLTILIACTSLPALAKDLTILYTNDIHAKADPFIARYIDNQRLVGGFANVAAFVAKEKAKNTASVFFDAGDYFSGSTIDSLTKGEAIIDIMNQMGYDAVSIGNHEFDYGWDNALVQLSKANFEVLLGNAYFENSDKPFWDKPYTIIERDGIKLGVIGLHGEFAFNDTVAAEMRQNIEVRDEVKYLQKYVNELKANVDVTIALIHQGTPARQSSSGATDVRRALDKDIETAKQIDGLDVLITGHAHVGTPKPIQVNDTLILSTDAYGVNVGKLVIDFDEDKRDIRGYEFDLQRIWADEWEPNQNVQASIDKWKQYAKYITDQQLTTSPEVLTRSYGESSKLGNLVADSILATFKDAELAFTNSGGIREDIDAGELSYGELIDALPFPNYPVSLQLTGEQIKSLLEHAASLTNGVMQTSSGFYYEYDSRLPAGNRILKATLNGDKLDSSRVYRVATNNFLADGGDGFVTFTNGINRINIPKQPLHETVKRYLSNENAFDKINEVRISDIAP